MIRVVELFAGIGAPRKALLNLNINFETCFFSEINKNAEKAYRSIFNDYTSPNLGDITKITEQQIENYKDQVDLLVFGSPCQDFSQAGLNKGGLKGSSTRSSLLWEGLRIINILKPKIVLFENVKNIIRKHNKILLKYINNMRKLGYFYKRPAILNSLSFGIPQNRERVFVLFSLNKTNISKYKFKNMMNKEKNYVNLRNYLKIKDFSKRKCLNIQPKYDFCNFMTWDDKKGNINGSYNRAWKINKYCGTLSYSNVIKITDGKKVSKITPKESILLMGFTELDYSKLIEIKLSNNTIQSLAGNSIVVNVLESIFKCLKIMKK